MSKPLRVGFLTYDLQPFTADCLTRISAKLAGRLRAYPVFANKVSPTLTFSYRPSQLQGNFFSLTKSASTPEGFPYSINWGCAWSFVWENDVLILFGIQGGSSLLATLLAVLLRRPLIAVNQTLPPAWEGKRRWWVLLLKGWILRRCRVHLVQSAASRHALPLVYGIAQEQMVDAPFESGATVFQAQLSHIQQSRDTLRQNFGWDAETCIFLFVGNLMRLKGLFTLMEAARLLKEQCPTHKESTFKVIIIGISPKQPTEFSLEEYRHHVAAMGLAKTVIFTGPRTMAELATFYLAADACLLPTEKDTWGKVLVEAALAGLPLVTTEACGSAGELVLENETGFIIPPSDLHALVNAMNKLLDPALRHRLGTQARRHCQIICDPERETAGFIQAIQKVL